MSFPTVLTDLASAVESTSSVRTAFSGWQAPHDRTFEDPVARVARRARLGAPWRVVIEPLAEAIGADAWLLADLLETQARHGGPLAPGLRSLASMIEDRQRMRHEATAASAAARTSVRLLAGLGVTVLVVLPQWRQASAAVMVGTSVCVGALVWGARAWVRRLVPAPPGSDTPAAALARRLEGSLGAGLDISEALSRETCAEARGSDLGRARAKVALGASWPEALAAGADEQMGRLAELIRRAQRSGTDLRPLLTAFAAKVREEERRVFDLRARRAPVLLVLPLTLLMLPAFAIVVLLPLLRSVAG